MRVECSPKVRRSWLRTMLVALLGLVSVAPGPLASAEPHAIASLGGASFGTAPFGSASLGGASLEPGSDDCAICHGTHFLVCLRCDGVGRCTRPCKTCDGRRTVSCPLRSCNGNTIPCGACDGLGRIVWQSGDEDPCKVCSKKGSFDCPLCKGGRVDCPACAHSGKQVERCVSCLGVGRMPCPRCESPKCVLCQGARRVRCNDCEGQGKRATTCEECYGYGIHFCAQKRCVNGMLVCETCYGSGVSRKVFTGSKTAAGASKCTACKGRGYEKCGDCKKGVVDCDADRDTEPCERCRGGWIECPGCG